MQPWTAGTGCDEPDAPAMPPNPTPHSCETASGSVWSVRSASRRCAAIVNPGLNGWAGARRLGIDDNQERLCHRIGSPGLDTVTLGNSAQNPYYLQREFNNAGALEFDP